MATAECKTITTPEITIIKKTECIGNSLPALNNNFLSLQTAICEVDSNVNQTNLLLTNIQNTVNTISTQQFAKAWASFSGRRREDPENPFTGRTDFTNANRFLRSNFNITNVVRNNIGDYTLFFATLLPENYITTGFVSMAPESTTTFTFTKHCIITFSPNENPTPDRLRVKVVDLDGISRDPEYISIVIFGGIN